MRTLPINKVMSYLAPSLITTGLFVSSTVLAMPLQGSLSTTANSPKEVAQRTKTETGSLTKPVLVRNTTAKTEPVVVATTTAPTQKTQDKKAISRCWKRLMNMVHEVSHAHPAKSRS